ncbi:MAG: hypothetical protein ACR2NW_05365 [Thermodesulfobacteriota bacterium]
MEKTSITEKKSYTKPKLTVYGKIKNLTLGIGGSMDDSGQKAPSKMGLG